MKKIKFIIIPLLCMMLSVNIMAHTAGGGVYEFADEDKVVTFEDDCTLTEDEQQAVAERLVYGSAEDSGIQTYSWCWLTGHNLSYNTVAVITHKARATQPRCLEERYNVATCSNCDYMEEDLLTTVYIICCD